MPGHDATEDVASRAIVLDSLAGLSTFVKKYQRLRSGNSLQDQRESSLPADVSP
jgi:hypothetical protein